MCDWNDILQHPATTSCFHSLSFTCTVLLEGKEVVRVCRFLSGLVSASGPLLYTHMIAQVYACTDRKLTSTRNWPEVICLHDVTAMT